MDTAVLLTPTLLCYPTKHYLLNFFSNLFALFNHLLFKKDTDLFHLPIYNLSHTIDYSRRYCTESKGNH